LKQCLGLKEPKGILKVEEMATSYRQGRVFAMQAFYACDIGKREMVQVLPGLEKQNPIPKQQLEFGMAMIDHVQTKDEAIDVEIDALLENWSMNRLANLDKHILRIAFAELLYVSKTPSAVVVSEATAIAKKFSTEDSAKFVSGLLHSFAKKLGLLLDKKEVKSYKEVESENTEVETND
jgi:transcription antitermination protein NusB